MIVEALYRGDRFRFHVDTIGTRDLRMEADDLVGLFVERSRRTLAIDLTPGSGEQPSDGARSRGSVAIEEPGRLPAGAATDVHAR